MAFGDQIYRQNKNNDQGIAMKAKSFLSKTILNVTLSTHKTRRLSLFTSIETESVINSRSGSAVRA